MLKLPATLRQQFSGSRGIFGSRQNIVSFFKTLALVVPLTLLIWIYAQRAQVGGPVAVQITMDVKIDSPNQTASLMEPANGQVTIEIQGPTASIERLKATLVDVSRESRLRVSIPPTYPLGDSAVPVASLLNDYALIKSSGVTVLAAMPQSVKVRLESVATRYVPVMAPPAGALPFTAINPIFDPHVVKVTGATSILNRLFPTPADGVVVDLPNPESFNSPGAKQADSVPVRLHPLRVQPGDEDRVTIDTPRLTSFRFDVAALDEEWQIRSMPIEIKKPSPLEGRTVVTLARNTVTNVLVRGPAASIRQLQPRANEPPLVIPTAVLRIALEDVGRSDIRRAVEITNLPQGVTMVGMPPEIDFSVQDLGATP
ncbi:MAG: hypothetical protein H7144_11935 [Burkholderiales bacterium]|nr:hypothetical protein [Phycisphaerae bacterium]